MAGLMVGYLVVVTAVATAELRVLTMAVWMVVELAELLVVKWVAMSAGLMVV